ncbi:cyclic nucleotide-binding domain-containing protein [Halpernia frigidisoli]|uniref:hypothetical protein n=1 Tax=Halpernia frigidisoli TaxID=1125876 RepID=UPI001F2ADAC5|nr:hypothetical protein [Halpernia frigidisoli]
MNYKEINMYDKLFRQLEEKIVLTEKEKEVIPSFFDTKILRKREYLCLEGDYCKNLAFVSRGALKSYTIDDKGQELLVCWLGKVGRFQILKVLSVMKRRYFSSMLLKIVKCF